MKLFILLVLSFFLILFISCNNDDDLNISLSSTELVQTTWDGVDCEFVNEKIVIETKFKLLFNTSSGGTYIYVDELGNPYGDGDFSYNIDKRIISFAGAIIGNWTVVEKSDNQIVLSTYSPQKHLLKLIREE